MTEQNTGLDCLEISPDTVTGTTNSVKVMFRAYVDQNKIERLVWKIGDELGNNALLDKANALVSLPQGKSITIGGRSSGYVRIPRWMADALIHDIEKFETDTIDLLDDDVDAEDRPSIVNKVKQEGDVSPMFDDIEVGASSEEN